MDSPEHHRRRARADQHQLFLGDAPQDLVVHELAHHRVELLVRDGAADDGGDRPAGGGVPHGQHIGITFKRCIVLKGQRDLSIAGISVVPLHPGPGGVNRSRQVEDDRIMMRHAAAIVAALELAAHRVGPLLRLSNELIVRNARGRLQPEGFAFVIFVSFDAFLIQAAVAAESIVDKRHVLDVARDVVSKRGWAVCQLLAKDDPLVLADFHRRLALKPVLAGGEHEP
jgi:hypothetical protein